MKLLKEIHRLQRPRCQTMVLAAWDSSEHGKVNAFPPLLPVMNTPLPTCICNFMFSRVSEVIIRPSPLSLLYKDPCADSGEQREFRELWKRAPETGSARPEKLHDSITQMPRRQDFK